MVIIGQIGSRISVTDEGGGDDDDDDGDDGSDDGDDGDVDYDGNKTCRKKNYSARIRSRKLFVRKYGTLDSS